jgi:hypothetical protein
MNLGNKWTLETIESTEMILACLCSLLDALEILYIPWFLSGMGGIGLNHSTYARYVGTSPTRRDWITIAGI